MAAVAVSSCTSASLTSASPLGKCTFSVTPPSPLGSSGGAAVIGIATSPECAWTASSDANWIAEVTPKSGQGNGEVRVQVMANPDPSPRETSISINGERAALRQDAACQFAVAAPSVVGPAAGATTVTVTAVAACGWTAVSSVPWITITSAATGTGNGSVTLTIAANPSGTRTGTVVIAGQTVTVTQAAVGSTVPTCSYSLGSTSQSAGSPGGISTPVSVTTSAGCAWTAVSNAAWITISSGASGSGSGSVAFNIALNPAGPRSGTLTIAGHTHTVNQAGNCAYSINPSSQSIAAGGGNGTSIAVTTGTGCQWTASSNASWLSIASGANGNGSGSVGFTAASNAGPQRTGTLTIAGTTFTVTQANGCAYVVAPLDQTLPGEAGPGTPIGVTTAGGCTWTAEANEGWITITSATSGTGNGTVTFTVTKSGKHDRTGTLTVAGRTVTVLQLKD